MSQLSFQLVKVFENYLAKKNFIVPGNKLYLPIKYMLKLQAKRLRPLLCLMACQLNDDNYNNALPAAAAIEYFHNFTLMHDDIMDNATLRRNEPTVSHKFGINAAILSGDLMMINAYQYLEELNIEHKLICFNIFSKAAVEVCEGQQLDMEYENKLLISTSGYIKMISMKTAALIACSLKMGALIGGLPEKDCNNLFDFGKNLGITFQLLDDILDVYGNKEKFGKKHAGDIVQNKKTYLLIKALELANENQKEKMFDWMGKTGFVEAEKIGFFLDVYNQLNIETLSRQKAKEYHQKAFESLNKIDLPNEKKQPLKDYANYLLNRIT